MSSSSSLTESLKVILQALVLAVVIRTCLFQPFSIPSGSLIPTLQIGDYLVVSKYSYGLSRYSFPYAPPLFKGRLFGSEPERGDIAVFRNLNSKPGGRQCSHALADQVAGYGCEDYIKRIVGLPGDKIQMVQGLLHINGKPVTREALGEYTVLDAFGRTVKAPMYREMLPNGRNYITIEREGDNGYWDNTPVYEVPQGHYFAMGDNRDNSTDSRELSQVGFVSQDALIGRAEIVVFSWNSKGTSPADWLRSIRWERMFQPIR